MSIITDKKLFNEVLNKKVNEIIDRESLEKKLSSGGKLRIKLGIDPTSPNIHIGRAVVLWKLREFQNLGHTAVLIVGDFTGLIGDTSDKDSERPMLSEQIIKTNMKTYFDQAFKILDPDKTETRYNSEWLAKLDFLEISKIADLFSLHEFEAREMIARRLKAGRRISLREILYPLMQGFDSVEVKADVELGGTDQRFNLLAGRKIQSFYGQKPQDIVITKFPLEGPDGRKMSSSWGNVINITDKPSDMFGKVMSISDNLIIKYFELATNLSPDKIARLNNELELGTNPREIKKQLAEEITTLYHGRGEAKKAKDEFQRVFSEGGIPEDVIEINKGGPIKDLLASSGITESVSESKRLIEQGGVYVNGERINDWNYELRKGDSIKIGSRKFLKIK